MSKNDFAEFVEPHLSHGYGQILHALKTLVYSSAPGLFDLLDFDNDDAFLEPLLFAYFNSKDRRVGLEQILIGYIADDRKPLEISVYADSEGVVYLPNVGYLITDRRDRTLTLVWRKNEGTFELREAGLIVDFETEPLIFVDGTSIEVCRHNNPLLAGFYTGPDGTVREVETTGAAEMHVEHLNQAFRILKACHPTIYALLVKVTRKLAVFQSPALNSFATLSAHGVAFLNATIDDDHVFFIEDLVHQCGHIVCNTATFEKQQYFLISPETPLVDFTREHGETRTVYATFHGVFTEVLMNHCFSACFDEAGFVGREKHELAGRLAFILRRFELDLQSLTVDGIFSNEGLMFLSRFTQVFLEIHARRRDLLVSCDTSNQSYNFCYRTFLELNPADLALTTP